MPFSLPNIDVLQEGLLGDTFFTDCWPGALPAAQQPPGAADLRALDVLLQDDAAVVALPAADRTTLRDAVLAVERRVPFLTASGGVLPAPQRLLLSLEIAKVFRCVARDDVARLASVVAYPGVTKLRRGHDGLGALLMRGAYRLLPLLAEVERSMTMLLGLSVHGGNALKAWRREAQRFVDDSQAWRAKIAPGKALPEAREEFTETVVPRVSVNRSHVQSAGADEFGRVLRGGRALFGQGCTLLQRQPALAPVIAATSVDLDAFAALQVASCDTLLAHSDDVTLPAQASIHLSWAMQLACHARRGHDPLVHELAHLVDFAHGGIDGAPAAAVADRWGAAWDELEAGGLAFLDPYARTNRGELLAVATEAFFTDGDAVRSGSASLAQLLEDTWGWRPTPRAQRSSWWVGRRLLFSPFSGNFD